MDTFQTFNFILDNESVAIDTPQEPPDHVGPNLAQIAKMTRKKFGEDILNVYQTMGGADWLFIQAQADPKAFFELLKKMIPNPTIADNIADITIKLINKYNESIEIKAHSGHIATSEQGSGQPEDSPSQTATGGTPNPVKLIERYDE